MSEKVTGSATRRTRSEKRKRTVLSAVRWTHDEKASAEANALAAGLDLGAFVRLRTTGKTGPRIRSTRVAPDLAALADVRGTLGYLGNNLNQLTRLANMGDMDRPADLDRVLARLMELLDQLRDTLRGPA
jgi:hypothetical protein